MDAMVINLCHDVSTYNMHVHNIADTAYTFVPSSLPLASVFPALHG